MRAVLLVAAVLSSVACGSGASSSGPAGGDAGGDALAVGDGVSSSGGGSGSSSGGSGSSSGASSGSSSGGSSGSGSGSSSGAPSDGGITDAGSSGGAACKRGVASNGPPPAALAPSASSPGVSWWYDWSPQGTPPAGVEFVPMIWGAKDLTKSVPAGSRTVLGFNEPNFKAQSNLTPAQAAADWPQVEAIAKAAGAQLVSPAVNFCGGCSDPAITDPYTWLKDFFAACAGCQVDAIAVHWYNCDLPSLKAYIEGSTGSGGLQGFVQFGKPIWLTEFSCGGSSTVAQQKAYMQAAVPYLENNPHVARYSWFSASPIPNALLTNPDGTLTDLGTTYASLPQTCK